MLDFVPFFQIIIGVYLSFCFDKLVQSLFWSDEFTRGLKDFYSEWSTLVWNSGNQNDIHLQKGIEKSINSYIARTKKTRNVYAGLCSNNTISVLLGGKASPA